MDRVQHRITVQHLFRGLTSIVRCGTPLFSVLGRRLERVDRRNRVWRPARVNIRSDSRRGP